MATLYEISDELHALHRALEEEGGEVSEELAAWIARLDTKATQKVDGYCAIIAEFQRMADARKAEAKRLLDLVQADQNKVERMKEALLNFFRDHGIDRYDTDRFRLAVCNNGGKLPLHIDENVDPRKLPPGYRRIEYRPDGLAIRRALEGGATLPFARLGERGQHLKIQ